MTGTGGSLPTRPGARPATTDTNPHTQLDQNPSRPVYAELAERLATVPDAHVAPSRISRGARALVLDDGVEPGPPEAFIIGREFGHLHLPDDGSLHLTLPPGVADQARARGWAERHPVAVQGMIPETVVMVYAPRDSEEVDVVMSLVETAGQFARGD